MPCPKKSNIPSFQQSNSSWSNNNGAYEGVIAMPDVSFSSCQRNLIKTFQIEGMIALNTKMTLIFSSHLLNGQK